MPPRGREEHRHAYLQQPAVPMGNNRPRPQTSHESRLPADFSRRWAGDCSSCMHRNRVEDNLNRADKPIEYYYLHVHINTLGRNKCM